MLGAATTNLGAHASTSDSGAIQALNVGSGTWRRRWAKQVDQISAVSVIVQSRPVVS